MALNSRFGVDQHQLVAVCIVSIVGRRSVAAVKDDVVAILWRPRRRHAGTLQQVLRASASCASIMSMCLKGVQIADTACS